MFAQEGQQHCSHNSIALVKTQSPSSHFKGTRDLCMLRPLQSSILRLHRGAERHQQAGFAMYANCCRL
jgi:hypothetical protein